jgi:nicotinamide phosphoribosyltransferase
MFDLSKIVNAVLMSDSYKNSHYGFSPKGLTEIYSNGTPRFDYYFKEKYPEFEGKYVQFGHQYMVRMIHSMYETFFKTEKSEAIKQISDVLGPYLNETNYERHKKLHSLGYLPIEFRALEEGSLVNIGVPSFTIRNTHPDFSWLTNYLETIISCELWKPMTVATVARQFHLLSKKYSDKTCDSDVHLNFQNLKLYLLKKQRGF